MRTPFAYSLLLVSSTLLVTPPVHAIDDIPLGETHLIQGNNTVGNLNQSSSGFAVYGTLRLESAVGGYNSSLTITEGVLTNALGGLIEINQGSGGPRNITGNLDNFGTFQANYGVTLNQVTGTYRNAGTFNIGSGATVSISGQSQTFEQNAGTLNITGGLSITSARFEHHGGTITGSPYLISSTLAIDSGVPAASFLVTGTSSVEGDVPAGQTIWLQGNNTGGTSRLHVEDTFQNAGTLRFESAVGGYVSYLNIGSGSGTMTNLSGGTLTFGAGTGGPRGIEGDLANFGTVNIDYPTDLPNGRTFYQNAGQLNLNSSFDLTGITFRYNGGTITGVPFLNGSTLHLGATATQPAEFTLASGSSTFTGNIKPGQLVWVQGNGTVGNTLITVSEGFQNAGTLRVGSLNGGYNSSLYVSNGTLTNSPNGTLHYYEGAAGPRTFGANLLNQGTVDIDINTTFEKSSGVYDNLGLIDIAEGRTLTIVGNNQVFNQIAGAISGGFYMNGAVFNYLGGDITNSPYLVNTILNLGEEALEPASFILTHSGSRFTGDIKEDQLIWVRGDNFGGHTWITLTNGFVNSGTLRFESVNGGYYTSMSVSEGTVTNAASGVIEINPGAGGSRTFDANLLNQGTFVANTGFSLSHANGVYENLGDFNITSGTMSLSGQNQHFIQRAGELSGSVSLNDITFSFYGGTIVDSLYLLSSRLYLDSTATDSASFMLSGSSSSFVGDIKTGQSIWVRGDNSGGHSHMTITNGFKNSGTLRVESVNGGYHSGFSVVNGTLTNAAEGVININVGPGGPRALNANVQNFGEFNVNSSTSNDRGSGVFDNYGDLTIAEGYTFTLSGTNQVFNQFDGTLTGALRMTGANSVFNLIDGSVPGPISLNGITFNYQGGSFNGNAYLQNSVLNLASAATAGAEFTLSGSSSTFTGNIKSGQTLWIQGNNSGFHTTITVADGFQNFGTLKLESIHGGYISSLVVEDGTLTNAASGRMEINPGPGGPRTITANILNLGDIAANTSLTLNKENGVYENRGNFTLAEGYSLTINGGSPTFTQTSGTLSGAFSFAGLTFNYNGGTIVGTPYLDACLLNLGAGAIDPVTFILARSSSSLTGDIKAGQTVWLQGNGWVGHMNMTVTNGFQNAGTLRLAPIHGGYDTSLTVSEGTFTNTPTGTVEILHNNLYGPRNFSANILNQGAFDINTTANFNRANGAFVNEGTIDISPNITVSVAGQFTQIDGSTQLQGSTLTVANGLNFLDGTFGGSGTVNGSVTNSGIVTPGFPIGNLHINGSFNQTADGVLALEIGGLTGVSEHDRLSVNGTATLNGRLVISLVNDFTPTNGMSFTLVTYGSSMGAFAAIDLPNLPNGLNWKLDYSNTALTLQVEAAPATDAQIVGRVKDNANNGIANVVVQARQSEAAGLLAEMYDTIDLSGPAILRLDPTVNFNANSPHSDIGGDTFSIRWSGYVTPRFSETYTFYTYTDDGARLWVNGQQIINQWFDHGPSQYSGTIELVAGESYTIVMEFYENGGGALAQMHWASPSQGYEIVPSSQLTPLENTNLPPTFSRVIVLDTLTDANGNYTLPVPNGEWEVDVAGLATAGFNPVEPQAVTVNGANVTVNFTAEAFSAERFLVTTVANPLAGGTTTGDGSIPGGANMTVRATANTETLPYYFANWTENGLIQSTNRNYTFTLTRDRNLVANFILPTYMIAASNNPATAGYISGAGTYTHAQTASLTANPYYGWRFVNWSENGVEVTTNRTLTFTVTGPRNLSANYAEAHLTHIVTTATSPAGLFSIAGAGTYNNGQSVTFTTPASITNEPFVYTFNYYTENGGYVSGTPEFTKTFATTDNTNLHYIAYYTQKSLRPIIWWTTANAQNPVGAITNYQLTFRFDRAMNITQPLSVLITNVNTTETILSTNGGTWTGYWVANDTYVTPFIELTNAMEGTNNVMVSLGKDPQGNVMFETNAYSLFVDTGPPTIEDIATTINPASTIITWETSELASGRVEYGPTTAYGTITPANGWRVTSHYYNLTGLLPDTLYHARVHATDAAGNTTISEDFTFTTASVPDLEVANLNVTPAGLTSGGALTVNWNINNTGAGGTSSPWHDLLIISNATTSQTLLSTVVYHNTAAEGNLAAGGSRPQSYTFTLPEGVNGAGNLQFIVVADYYNANFEFNEGGTAEANNTASINRTSTIRAYPDVRLQNLAVTPASPASGDEVTVDWQTLVVGSTVNVDFSERVIVRRGANTIASSFLTFNAATSPLIAGTPRDREFTFTLPEGPGGTGEIEIEITTDVANHIFEYHAEVNAEANNIATTDFTATLAPYPDLVVTEITAPETGIAGGTAEISWVVKNQGTATANGQWIDQFFLSTDAIAGTDQLVGSLTFSNALAAGESVTNIHTITLPAFGAGNRWVVVRADAANQVFEANETNNVAIAEEPISIPLQLALSITPSTVAEDAGALAAQGTLTRNASFGSALVVNLISSNTNKITVPETVTIPAGRSSASFSLRAVDDMFVGNNATVNVGASASGYTTVSANVTVVENDEPKLFLEIPVATVTEGAGAGSAVGYVTRNTSTNAALVVSLNSSDNTRLSVPTTVTILAGQTAVAFDLNPLDNNVPNSVTRVSITPAAAGFASIADSVDILDNDSPTLGLVLNDTTVAENTANPATIATLTRTPVTAMALSVILNSSQAGVAQVPVTVTFPANTGTLTFPVNVVNDTLATGPRLTAITAFAIDPLLSTRLTNSAASANLTVTDDEGPTLTVGLLSGLISETGTTTGTVTRNTPTTNPLTVNLTSSAPDEATVPATVIIPAGQTAVDFTVTGVSDGSADGIQRVSVTASASSFNSGVASLNVSDTDLPDLRVVAINAPPTATTSERINVTWVVRNSGLSQTAGSWTDRIFYSTSPSGSNPQFLGSFFRTGSLNVNSTYTGNATFTLPASPEPIYFVVTTDFQNTITEGSEVNNTFVAPEALNLSASYRVTVATSVTVAPGGTQVPFTGQALRISNNQPVTNVPVSIRLNVKGTRRVLNALTDASGNYTATFFSLPGEGGHFDVAADHPGVTQDTTQDSFELLAMRFTENNLNVRVAPGEPISGALELVNLSEVPLTGLTGAIEGLPDFVEVSFTATNGLTAGGSTFIQYTVSPDNINIPAYAFGTLRLTSTEGGVATLPVRVDITPRTASLVANPGSLLSGMTRGGRTYVEFDVKNEGGAPSGDLQLQLPNQPWLAAASPVNIASLAPGESTHIVLALTPANDLPLNNYTGTLVLNSANAGVSIGVPFQFRAISSAVGDLEVTVNDDFTFYAEGAPKVENAMITLTDRIANTVVARGTTDVTGILLFPDLMEGTYQLEVTADKHGTYRAPVTIVPGITNAVTAFIDRQTVSYRWTVVPTEIEDTYRIVLESVFETEVPIPVVTIDNPFLLPLIIEGEDTQMDISVSNQGLIAAEQVGVTVPEHPHYEFVPLIEKIDVLPAKSTVKIPVLVRAKSSAPFARSVRTVMNKTTGLPTLDSGNTITGCPIIPKIQITWSYTCGPDRRWHMNETQIVPVPADHDCGEAIKDLFKDRIKEIIEEGGNWKDLLKWKGKLCELAAVVGECIGDECVITIINMVCGVATGDALGAMQAALRFGQCWCPSLPSSPGGGAGPGGGGGGPGGGYYGGYYGGPGVSFSVPPIYWDYSPDCTPGDTTGGSMELGFRNVPVSANPTRTTTTPGAVCARVRVRIEQEAVITRAAFLGTLEIENGQTEIPLTGIQLTLDIRDASQNPANEVFAIRGPELNGISSVDGNGSLAAGAIGTAKYTFIPTRLAAPETPTVYRIGGTLRYYEGTNLVEAVLVPDTITVFPDPILQLSYFQQREVYADNPFTDIVEPSEPFALGLIVRNTGKGEAKNFRITSAQPEIIENEKGLLIDFKIIGTQEGTNALTPSLTANLGAIDPGKSKVAIWQLISTLEGKFIEYTATFEHIDGLGDQQLSLIDSVEIHELIRTVRADRATDDAVPDFLVNGIPDAGTLPDTLYLSDGPIEPVTVATGVSVGGGVSPGNLSVQLTAVMEDGWSYLNVLDPGVGYRLARVERSDGKQLRVGDNVWRTDRTFLASSTGATREHRVHLLDFDGTGSYTLHYRLEDANAPTIASVTELTPFVQPAAVNSIDITFSEAIDLGTFDVSDLLLTRESAEVELDNTVTVALVSGNTYRITGLSAFTGTDGNYLLQIVGEEILDFGENPVDGTANVRWAKGSAIAQILTLTQPTPQVRNVPVTSLEVSFTKPMEAASFDFTDITLTRNGGANLITSGVTVSALTATSFRIDGLAPLNTTEGTYVLSVTATSVRDTGGNFGTGGQAVTWMVDVTGPTPDAVETVATNPRNIVVQSLLVTFNEPINASTFTTSDITLTRNGGANLLPPETTLTAVNETTYRIANFSAPTGIGGNYVLTVNGAGIADVAGNTGDSSASSSWTLDIAKPTAPVIRGITPDLGTSNTDGLTSATNLTIQGFVGEGNLVVRLTDTTLNAPLGQANVTGTNFTSQVTFTTKGAHRISAVAIDNAGNFSEAGYFNVFIEEIGPVATVLAVTPDPRTNGVASIDISFSEAINVSTFTVADLSLKRNNGANLISGVTISALPNNVYRLNGLTTLTDPVGDYVLSVNATGVQDLAGNAGVGTGSETWTRRTQNTAPVLAPIGDLVVLPNDQITITNVAADADLPAQTLTFSLEAGAPSGATIDAAGVFSWKPTGSAAGTTNSITVKVTDNGSPALSASRTFKVLVSDVPGVVLGTTHLEPGDSGAVTIGVNPKSFVSSLAFIVSVPEGLLTDIAVQDLAPGVENATFTALTESTAEVEFFAPSGQILPTSTALAQLTFNVPSETDSAIARVHPSDIAAQLINELLLENLFSPDGRVFIVGNEPILDATLGTAGARTLYLYGQPGRTYLIESAPAVTGPWSLARTVNQTALKETITGLPAATSNIYYRVRQQ